MLINVLGRIQIIHIVGVNVQLIVGAVILNVLAERHLIVELHVEAARRLVRPAARNITNRVAAAAQQKHGHTKCFTMLHASTNRKKKIKKKNKIY